MTAVPDLTPSYQLDDRVAVFHGDCLAILRSLPDASVDAVITDPPYGLSQLSSERVIQALTAWVTGDREHTPDGAGFMGKSWDAFVPPPAIWDECFRVLKPGGHVLAFSGSRTYDLMGVSIRLAGFEIRDGVAWLNGQGFPKSFDISKGIDKSQGEQRERVPYTGGIASGSNNFGGGGKIHRGTKVGDTPVTDDAAAWQGWGTALKPSFEPVVVARKPLDGTVVENVLKHGVGGLNIDATRIKSGPSTGGSSSGRKGTREDAGAYGHDRVEIDRELAKGRWPANAVIGHSPDCQVIGTASDVFGGGAKATSGFVNGYEHDGFQGQTVEVDVWECVEGCQVAELDRQSGITTSTVDRNLSTAATNTWFTGNEHRRVSRGDSGGASRFFYTPKASKNERPKVDGVSHPTVKPLALMEWLVRLVTPSGGLVVDPFSGSGTTVEAALRQGMRVIGIEREQEYVPLIEQRVARALSEATDGPESGPVLPEPKAAKTPPEAGETLF